MFTKRTAWIAALSLTIASCTHARRVHVAIPTGWRSVTYQSAAFAVPPDWPIKEVGGFQWSCSTYRDPGVYLAPRDWTGYASCPLTDFYAATLHVGPLAAVGSVKGEPVRVNGQSGVVVGHDDNGWRSLAFPGLGVSFTFYGTDPARQEAVSRTIHRSG